VVDKFYRKLPKEQLKKFGKEINKKLVESDYKHHRVDDPTSISPKVEKKVKKYAHDFLNRALQKHQEQERRKATKSAGDVAETPQTMVDAPPDDVDMSDDEGAPDTPSTGSDRKRKRSEAEGDSPIVLTPSETPSVKRLREEEATPGSPPPPPPPPPPAEGEIEETQTMTEEERSMREQEEALMRENEEAERMAEQEDAIRQERQAKARRQTANIDRLDNGLAASPADEHGLDSSIERPTDSRKHEVMSH
jgi:[histone H3]-lysine36 N-trimethyltransferase